MQNLAYGVGLVPRELFLTARISTMQAYLNAPAQSNLTATQVNNMRTSGDPALMERSINAFQSAYETLGEHIYPDDTIALDELLPPGTDGSLMAKFTTYEQDFDTYALTYERKAGNSGGTNPNTFGTANGDCEPRAYPITIRALPVAVYKDPTILTYYAIRLRAKARVLFSPFGDIELKAYSAAMPFGSRIGPPLDVLQDTFAWNGASPPQALVTKATVAAGNLFDTIVKKIPNMPVVQGEGAQAGQGWDSNLVQYQFYSALVPGGGGGGGTINMQDLSRGAQASMAPNPWEAGHFNIINDLADDPFVRNFDKYKEAMVWAPLVPLDKSAQLTDIFTNEINKLFADNTGGTGLNPNQVGQFTLADFKTSILDMLSKYVDKIRVGQGEGDPYTTDNPAPADILHEGVNTAILTDPLSQRPTDVGAGGTPGPITVDPSVVLNDPVKIRDSWNKVNDGNFRKLGRVGYSVKFVSFDSLVKKSFATDSKGTTFTNGVGDGQSADDLAMIRH
jgi:hypothetical protein